jgi:hypothetical protein
MPAWGKPSKEDQMAKKAKSKKAAKPATMKAPK